MNFKLIIAIVADDYTDKIIDTAREKGATGATVITSGRGEGLVPHKTFLGLTFEGQMDMVLFVVERHLSREIIESIAEVGQFDSESGAGVVMQLDIEDVIGLKSQLKTIKDEIADQL